MTQINSPYFLSKIRPMGELSRPLNNYLSQLESILQQTYRRVGAENDSISPSIDDNISNNTAIYHLNSQLQSLRNEINDLQSNHAPKDPAISKILSRIDDIESSIPNTQPLDDILRRITDIEAQL